MIINLENVGKRLKELRKEQNMTQQAVADYLKIDRSNYSKYENGKLELNLSMLATLAELYKVRTDYLLGLED